jgi:hypothetical protein
LGPLLITSTLTVQQADGCLRTAAGAVSCPGVGLVPEFGYETCNCLTRQEESIQNCITSIPHLYGIDKNIQAYYRAILMYEGRSGNKFTYNGYR